MENEVKAPVKDLSAAPSKEKAAELIRILDQKLAEDLLWIDATATSEITDYYIVATGRSSTHVKSLADEVEFEASRRNIPFLHQEGRDGGAWLLLDFADVIVHVFSREARETYRFERLYKEEDYLDISSVLDD